MGRLSMLHKHSLDLDGLQTSISMEDEFWLALRALAIKQGMPVSDLVKRVSKDRLPKTTRTSAVRVFILREYMRQRASAA
jgi:predicted DNA-binding ribbon-helix-helix protein